MKKQLLDVTVVISMCDDVIAQSRVVRIDYEGTPDELTARLAEMKGVVWHGVCGPK